MGHNHLLRLGCGAHGNGRRTARREARRAPLAIELGSHVAKASVRRVVCLESWPGVRRLGCPGFCAPSTARPVKPAGRGSRRHHELRWSPRAASPGKHEQSESHSDESTQVSVARDRASPHSPEGCIENSAMVHMNVCSRLDQKHPSAAHPFGNSEACSVAFRLHSRNALPSELRRHRSGRAHGPSG
jgi:hypothetical protein